MAISVRHLATVGLSLAALATVGSGTAAAVEGSVALPGPGGCDVEVFWNTNEDPMAGAYVPHYNACLRPVYEAIHIGP